MNFVAYHISINTRARWSLQYCLLGLHRWKDCEIPNKTIAQTRLQFL